jgi:hypothetical protein
MDRGILSRIISSAILVLMFAMVSEAQGPTAKSSPSGHASIALPVNPPPGWRPDLWAGERADCQRLADEYASGKPLAQSEFPLAEGCRRLSSMHISSDADSSTTPAASAQPTPIPSPGGPAPAAASSPGAVGPFEPRLPDRLLLLADSSVSRLTWRLMFRPRKWLSSRISDFRLGTRL